MERFAPSRWVVLAVACACSLISGTGYAFGIFSGYLKTGPLKYTQSEVRPKKLPNLYFVTPISYRLTQLRQQET